MGPQSLKRKLIKLQLLMTTIVLLVSWIFISIDDFYIFRKVSLDKFKKTSKVLAQNLSTCLVAKVKEDCQRVLSTLKLADSIYHVSVIDEKGNTFVSYSKTGYTPGSGNPLLRKGKFQYAIKGNELFTSYPIHENGIDKGRLFLIAEFNMMKTFGTRHAIAFAIIMLGSFCLTFFLFHTFNLKIIGQLKLLINTIHKIGMDKSYSLRVQDDPEWKSTNIVEFRQLGESFDAMIAQVEIRDYSMNKQNKDLEKLIEVKVQELLRSAELASLGEMAGGIAHEINNPLTIIKSSNRVMMKLIDKEELDRATFKEFLRSIDLTVDRIAKIVSGLRNISRKSLDTDIAACTYNDIFTDVLEVAEPKFRSKGIELRKSYSQENANLIFLGNRIQLSQILVNLFNNSFDAIIDIPENDKWIEINLFNNQERLELHLTDCGNGIPLKIREKMFNPFFTTKEIGKGTGIGLAISKSMIEKMGGELFYNDKCSNTCFVISLKL